MKRAGSLSIPTTLEEFCNPRRAALLVYDMQVGICRQVKESARIVERCQLTLAAAREAGMRVVFTRHLSCPREWMGTTQLRSAMVWQGTGDPEKVEPWFPRDAPASKITPELAPRADELILDKVSMSAFEGTPLAFALRDCGIVSIAVVGIAMEIGIEPTVRHATDLGFVPIVLADACGAGHAEAGERCLDTMRFLGEAVISNVESFARACATSRVN